MYTRSCFVCNNSMIHDKLCYTKENMYCTPHGQNLLSTVCVLLPNIDSVESLKANTEKYPLQKLATTVYKKLI